MLLNFDRWFLGNLCFAADAGDGGGGSTDLTKSADDGDSGGEDEKKFTQKDLDEKIAASMKHWRKGMQKELSEKDTQLKAVQVEYEELKKELEQKTAVIASGKDKTMEGQIELLQTKHQRQLEELRKEIETEKVAREAAEKKAFETRRDNEIYKALEVAGCIDSRIGYRVLAPEVQYDAEENNFFMHTKGGKLVGLEEGVREFLPDYLKRPATDASGSGSKTGSRSKNAKVSELEAKKKRFEEMTKTVNRRDRNAVASWEALRKEIRAMEAELTKTVAS